MLQSLPPKLNGSGWEPGRVVLLQKQLQ